MAKPFRSNATKFCVALSGLVFRWLGGMRATDKEKPGKPFRRPGYFLFIRSAEGWQDSCLTLAGGLFQWDAFAFRYQEDGRDDVHQIDGGEQRDRHRERIGGG